MQNEEIFILKAIQETVEKDHDTQLVFQSEMKEILIRILGDLKSIERQQVQDRIDTTPVISWFREEYPREKEKLTSKLNWIY